MSSQYISAFKGLWPTNLVYNLPWTLEKTPRIFEKDGFTFFFYSNDHRPVHVHVRYGGGEAVFNVESGIELRESHGLKMNQLGKAEDLIREHLALILEKWHEHLGR